MAFKANVDVNPRTFVVAAGGDDRRSGQTEETAKLTIQAAIDEVNLLSPPPSPSEPAAILSSGSGIFRENIVIPDACQFNGENISNNPLTGNAFEVASDAPFNITSSVVFGDGAIAFDIPNKNNVGIRASAVACIGPNSIGAHLTGSSDNIFLTFSQVRLQGANGIGILDESLNGAPEIFNINELTISGDDCCGIRYNPQIGSSTATFNFGSILDTGSPTGTVGIDVIEGRLSAFGNTIVSETALRIENGATLDIISNNIIGNIIVDVGGTLNCNIQRFTGNITNNGTINGIIADDQFGNGNSQSTTYKFGGAITQGALNTQIDITSGSGTIYDYTDPANVLTFPIKWDAFTNVDLTLVASELFTFIGIDRTGQVVQFAPTGLSFVERRDNIIIGTVVHASGVFENSNSNFVSARETHAQFLDLLDALGVVKASGFVVQPNSDLTFDKTAGILMNAGAGNTVGNRAENAIQIAAEVPTVFSRFLGTQGSSTLTGQTNVDPANFDDGSGTEVSVPGGPSVSTIQYIFQFPVDGSVLVQYGQTTYPTLADAVAGAGGDNPTIPIFIRQDALLVARIALENGCTDLSDDTQAIFLSGAKFGIDITGGSGGSGAGGGDVFGPASSTTNELSNFADATGKILDSNSDVTLSAGDFQRITTNGDLTFLRNGIGKVHFGNGAILGDFGASETLGATTFSIASPLGFTATVNYEHNGILAGTSGFHFVEDAIALRDTPTGKGIYIETDGQISLGDQIVEPDFSVIVGSFTNPLGLPQLNNAAEAAVTGRPRMIHYNSILEAIRYYNLLDNEFQSLMVAPNSALAGEIPTFSITQGHRLEANSDVSITAGVMQRITNNQSFRINRSGTGVVQFGAGSILGTFGVVEQTIDARFSVASNNATGSMFITFEQNSTTKGIVGFDEVTSIFGLSTADGGGVFVDGGRTFIGIIPDSIPAGVACKIGSSGINTMMVPEIGQVVENILTGVTGMFHYNTTLNRLRYFDGFVFQSLANLTETLNAVGVDGVTNTVLTSGTYVDVEIPTLDFIGSDGFVAAVNGVEYTGPGFTGDIDIEYTSKSSPSVSAAQYDFRAFVFPTVPITTFFVHTAVSTTTDMQANLYGHGITLNTGDIIRLRCKGNITSSTTALRDIKFTAKAF